MTIKSNIDENKLSDRAYQIISEIIPYLQEVGLKDNHQLIINDLTTYMDDCFSPNLVSDHLPNMSRCKYRRYAGFRAKGLGFFFPTFGLFNNFFSIELCKLAFFKQMIAGNPNITHL